MPPLRRTRICSPRPSASTMTAHSLKAIRTQTNYPLPRRKSRVRPDDGGAVPLRSGLLSELVTSAGALYCRQRAELMNKAIRFKLFLMMVLEFFIWGAWFPLIFGYLPSLGFSSTEQSWILNAFPIAAIA